MVEEKDYDTKHVQIAVNALQLHLTGVCDIIVLVPRAVDDDKVLFVPFDPVEVLLKEDRVDVCPRSIIVIVFHDKEHKYELKDVSVRREALWSLMVFVLFRVKQVFRKRLQP